MNEAEDYALTIFDRQSGELVGTFHEVAYCPDDAFERIARQHPDMFPGVDCGLPLSSLRTELYEIYDYDISGVDE